MISQRDTTEEIREMFTNEPLANWNGQLMPLSEVRVSVLDRSFLFGDAIYEVIRVYNGKPFLYEEHIARLGRNIDKMLLPADAAAIATKIEATLAASDVESGTIYVQVTRGVAPRAHRFPNPPPKPNELIYVTQYNDRYAEQRINGAAAIIQEDLRWKRCDIKSVNLLANCMAAQAAYEADCVETLLVDSEGELIEGSHSSLFGVRSGTILTAPLGPNLLPGITRSLLLQLADECGITLLEETLHSQRLGDLDELFLTGTTSEIMPIIKVDSQTIGNGTVGPVVQQLQTAFAAKVATFVR